MNGADIQACPMGVGRAGHQGNAREFEVCRCPCRFCAVSDHKLASCFGLIASECSAIGFLDCLNQLFLHCPEAEPPRLGHCNTEISFLQRMIDCHSIYLLWAKCPMIRPCWQYGARKCSCALRYAPRVSWEDTQFLQTVAIQALFQRRAAVMQSAALLAAY